MIFKSSDAAFHLVPPIGELLVNIADDLFATISGESCVPTLWVGTNAGIVFIYQLVYMTDAKDHGPIECRCFLGKVRFSLVCSSKNLIQYPIKR